MSCDCFIFTQEKDEFRMWQGLVGPYYTPSVDSLGNLSWTNNGQLVNPPTVNVSGRGLTITGIVDTSGDLPASAPQYTVYLVGTTSPYHGYIFDGTSWVDIGIIGKGDTGNPGADGFSPIVTVTPITDGHQVSIEDAYDTHTFNVMNGEGVPSGGTDGQMLVKDGATDYATKWADQPTIPSAYTSTPEMDGIGSAGSSTSWAKGDHVHPSDTSKQDTLGNGDVTTNMLADGAVTRAKLADDALFSPNVAIAQTPYNISASDIGKTLILNYAASANPITINLTLAISQTLPIGTEIAILNNYKRANITIATDGIRVAVPGIDGGGAEGLHTNGAHQFKPGDLFSMIGLKKLTQESAGDIWLFTGNVEVVT